MSLSKSKRSLGMGRPKLVAKNKLKKSRITMDDDEDDEAQITPQPSFLTRENQLSNLFSSQENGLKYNNKKPVKLKHNFEEDGEFIYKRSQSPTQPQSRKKRKVNTPISQLHEEMDLLARGNLDSDSEDIFALKKSRKKEKQRPSNSQSNGGTRLRSPLRDGYKSDDYIEHVSLEKLALQDHSELGNYNKRRQSYTNRGKRVSSIGNGFVGEPHKDIPVSDYYKLLDTSLPAPDRMRQLLVWTMKRQLEKDDDLLKQNPPANHTAASIARVIKEELINDLIEKKISTSWYDKKDANSLSGKIITVPNPINESNRQNIDLYSKKVRELKRQKEQWKEVFKQSIAGVENLHITLPNDNTKLKQYLETERTTEIGLSVIDGSVVQKLEQDCENVKKLFLELPPIIDRLYYASHQLNQASKLINSVEENKLGPELNQYLQSYVSTTNPPSESKAEQESTAETSNKFDTMALLKAICYVETVRDKSKD